MDRQTENTVGVQNERQTGEETDIVLLLEQKAGRQKRDKQADMQHTEKTGRQTEKRQAGRYAAYS